MSLHLQRPRAVIVAFSIFALVGAWLAFSRLKFSFSFEDFFPTNDPDLAFFNEFKKRFEPDDNFLLIGIRREAGVFEQSFLKKVQDFTEKAQNIEFGLSKLAPTDRLDGQQIFRVADSTTAAPNDSLLRIRPVLSAQSILQVEYPIKTPFAFTTIPAVHIDEPERYEGDREKILSDERLAGTLLSKDGKTLVVALKTVDNIQQEPAEKLIAAINDLLRPYQFETYHLLGRANFQKELVELQMREFFFSCTVSFVLVLVVMFLIFRKPIGVFVASVSIIMGLGVFVGMLGVLGATLDTMALLYPIVMIIVATSDVVHVMTKYTDELQKGHSRSEAIKTTLREIGLSVFLTSATTAIGFASLITSRVAPIRFFGIYAALGVMLAYATVIIFTTALLTLFSREQIIAARPSNDGVWNRAMTWFYHFTQQRAKTIALFTLGIIALCAWGISRITTNTQIEQILPRGTKVTADFQFFEKQFSGFRPYEIAITLQGDYTTDSFRVVQTIEALEQEIKRYKIVQSLTSLTALYKSLHRAYNGDQRDYYNLNFEEEDFLRYRKLAKKLENTGNLEMLVSKDKKHARVSGRVLDVGADEIRKVRDGIQAWIDKNVDPKMMQIRQTGTGIIVDKNAEYVRDSLLQGLGISVLLIALIMALLYRSWRMIIVFLIPNLLPLAIAGALLGFLQIPLEAGVAIVFGIIFGIAVDDTIHILGRYRLLRTQNDLPLEEALRQTLLETGKAVCLTSVILFSGFLILIFSSNPPAVTIGLLISLTLLTALVSDLFLIPLLLRWVLRN